MKIAKDINNNPVECGGTTSPYGSYRCFICGEEVYPCNDLKKENGRKKDYYFAHYKDNCFSNVESYLHRIAKEIIAAATEINMPDARFAYANAEVECTTVHPSLRPDVLLDKEVAIEICYSNPKTATHVQVFRDLNLSAVEIVLEKLTMESSLDEIQFAVLEDNNNRKYLFKKVTPSMEIEESQPLHPFVVVVLVVLAFFGLKELVQWFRK